jgi:hypothetical protein
VVESGGLENRLRTPCKPNKSKSTLLRNLSPFPQRLALQQLGGDVKHAALGAGENFVRAESLASAKRLDESGYRRESDSGAKS